MCSEIIVVDSKSASFLACLKEFKLSFVQSNLNRIYKTDKIIRTMLGVRKNKNKADLPKEMSSDLEIQCSLSFGMNQPPFTERPLSILITVDALNLLRVYLQYPD